MVGFSESFDIEGAAAAGEEKEDWKSELPLDSKKASTPSDQIDICLPELEDFSLSFSNSFLDLDSIDGWFVEGNSDFCSATDMADLGHRICVKDGREEVLGGKDASLCDLERGKAENGCERDMGDFGCFIEEQLGKVRLEGNSDCLIPTVVSENDKNAGGDGSVVNGCNGGEMVNPVGDVVGANGNKGKCSETVGYDDESESDAESGSESSSLTVSSDSPSSSSEEEEEEEDKNMGATSNEKKEKNAIGVEEGEIVLSDVDEMVGWSDNEDDDCGSGVVGPIMSKNELKVLPPIPPVTVTLEPHHETLPIGAILSIVGAQVIVEGTKKHNPLNEGSILWITESRSPLGMVDEIFGPVKNPYYLVRYNSENELPAGIQQGTSISFVQEFANHVLNNKSLYKKGYDASGENDEELLDEVEFSDDEKEAEYKRMLKMKKRGTNESKPGNKRKDKRQLKNQTRNLNHNQDPAAHGDRPPVPRDQNLVPPVATSSDSRQNMPGNQPMVPPFWYGAQPPGFSTSGGIWRGGFQPQPSGSVSLPSGLPSNGMLWMPQNRPNQLFQAPLPAHMPFQQQFSTLPVFPLTFNALGGQASFGGGPAIGAWPTCPDQNILNPLQFGMGLQAQQASVPQRGGGEQAVQQPLGFQTDPSAKTSPAPKFNHGRGNGRSGQQRGRGCGRFGARRGRCQSHQRQ